MCKTLVSRLLLLIPGLGVGGACAPLEPPARNGGPALSEKGLEVALVRQSCTRSREPDVRGWPLVEEVVEVRVRNGAPAPATVHRDLFRLRAPDGSALKTVTWSAADPLIVAGGASQTFEMRFQTHGGLECDKEMRLDPGAGITLGESPLTLPPVAFTPWRNPA